MKADDLIHNDPRSNNTQTLEELEKLEAAKTRLLKNMKLINFSKLALN